MTGTTTEQPDRARDEALLTTLCSEAASLNVIDGRLYPQFNVKRGLRNSDGTGVLVGLTSIGDVHGYIIDENERVPVEGQLYYRGYNVSDLVKGFQVEKRFGFEEVCYLLMFGALPTTVRLEEFSALLGRWRRLPADFVEDMILKHPSPSVMNKLARSVLVAYSFDSRPDDTSIPNVVRQSVELVARFPVMVAYGYQALSRYYQGRSLFLHDPKPDLSTAEVFLQLIRPGAAFTKLEAELLDLALVLHAEHGGGNNSAFTTHVVTSSGTDTYSALAAAVGSLKGPKHGGASIRVVEMIEDLKQNVRDWEDDAQVAAYLDKLVSRQAFDKSGLIYGIGHAVYTLSDPRAQMLKAQARVLAEEKGREAEFDLCDAIERLAPQVLRSHKGLEKPICANVDLYSGLVYGLLDIPPSMYTPLFAISRVAGWCAHRIEEIVSGGRIMRPAYKNVIRRRDYVPMEQR